MNFAELLNKKLREESPRLGNVLIPESAMNFPRDQNALPGAASDMARWAVGQGRLPAYQPPANAAPPLAPPQGSGPISGGRAPVARPGVNPFAAKAQQMGFADFQSAQASALRGKAAAPAGGASNG